MPTSTSASSAARWHSRSTSLPGGVEDLLDAVRVDPPVQHQLLQREPADLAAYRVEAGQQHRLRRVVDDQVDPGDRLERPDVAALAADDAALHLVAGQVQDADHALRGLLAGDPLDRVDHDVPGPRARRWCGRRPRCRGPAARPRAWPAPRSPRPARPWPPRRSARRPAPAPGGAAPRPRPARASRAASAASRSARSASVRGRAAGPARRAARPPRRAAAPARRSAAARRSTSAACSLAVAVSSATSRSPLRRAAARACSASVSACRWARSSTVSASVRAPSSIRRASARAALASALAAAASAAVRALSTAELASCGGVTQRVRDSSRGPARP